MRLANKTLKISFRYRRHKIDLVYTLAIMFANGYINHYPYLNPLLWILISKINPQLRLDLLTWIFILKIILMPKSFAAAPVDSRPERRLNMKVEYNNDLHTGSRPSLLSPSLFCRISVSVFRTLSPSSNWRVGLYRQQKTPNQCRAGDSPFGSACFFSLPPHCAISFP